MIWCKAACSYVPYSSIKSFFEFRFQIVGQDRIGVVLERRLPAESWELDSHAPIRHIRPCRVS